MSILQIMGVCSCLACLLVKWLLALKQTRLENQLEAERTSYKQARNALNEMVQKRKILMHTQKQIQAKSVTAQRNIGRLSQTKNTLEGQVEKEEELKARQKALISQFQNPE